MGRSIRRVPTGWEHPKDKQGYYIPLLEGPFSKRLMEWEEGNRQWNLGFREDWSNGGWKSLDGTEQAETYSDWAGEKPEQKDYMPEWPESEKTMFMMYEDTSEGTPISPAFSTIEEMAHWLADNKASAFGSRTATYEEWLSTCKNRWPTP